MVETRYGVTSFSKHFYGDQVALLTVLFAGVLVAALDIAIVGPALPAIQNQFGVNGREISWVFSSYILSGLISAPLMAKLSDRYGRRNVYLFDILIFGAGSLLVAASTNFELLLFGRVVQAIGAGGILPVASAVIGDTFPEKSRGPALGLIGAVFGIAFLLGPLFGGVLLQWSWRWLFLINLPIVLLVFWKARLLLPSVSKDEKLPFDWIGTSFLSISLLSLSISISWIDVDNILLGLKNPKVSVLLIVTLVSICFFWLAENRAVDPILPPNLFLKRELRLLGVIAIGTGLVEAGMIFLPSFAVVAFNVEEATASFMLVPLVFSMILGAPLAGSLIPRMGVNRVIQVGLLFVIFGTFIFSINNFNTIIFYLAGFLIGVGLSGILGAPLRFIIIKEVPVNQSGAGQGLLTTFLSIGRILGAAGIGGLIAVKADALDGYKSAYLVVGMIMIMIFFCSLFLRSYKHANSAQKN